MGGIGEIIMAGSAGRYAQEVFERFVSTSIEVVVLKSFITSFFADIIFGVGSSWNEIFVQLTDTFLPAIQRDKNRVVSIDF